MEGVVCYIRDFKTQRHLQPIKFLMRCFQVSEKKSEKGRLDPFSRTTFFSDISLWDDRARDGVPGHNSVTPFGICEIYKWIIRKVKYLQRAVCSSSPVSSVIADSGPRSESDGSS